jgi:hypothetical protein
MADLAPREPVEVRYSDLTCLEQVSRLAKTVLLEMRPVYVRLASRTRGQAFALASPGLCPPGPWAPRQNG